MRFLVLSRNASLYSTSRIVLAARARGHHVTVIDPLEFQIVVSHGKPVKAMAAKKPDAAPAAKPAAPGEKPAVEKPAAVEKAAAEKPAPVKPAAKPAAAKPAKTEPAAAEPAKAAAEKPAGSAGSGG